jgi:lipoate-protein ligase A
MLFVDSGQENDPRLNLATEEFLLRHLRIEEPLLLFYINGPSVIIGRNQNTIEEIDSEYVKDSSIHVVRRLSGGGAVYHDFGNLNFSFITSGSEDLHNFAKFTEPVIKVLRQLGVGAELRGRSDIFAEGKKISGNAQYATAGRMFSHGTLLFDTDLEKMLRALNPRRAVIESKAVQSIRNYVTNIRELLSVDIDIYGLRDALLSGIFRQGQIPTYELTTDDRASIQRISADRYRQWEWNYGHSPKFNVQKSGRTPAGNIDIRIDIRRGHIQSLKIFGDFSGSRPVAELERHLVGLRYDKDDLAAALKEANLELYFGNLESSVLLDLLF